MAGTAKEELSQVCERLLSYPSLKDFVRANATDYAKVGLIELYEKAGIREFLQKAEPENRTALAVAQHFGFQPNATARFLDAMAFLNVLKKKRLTYTDHFSQADLAFYRHSSDFIFALLDFSELDANDSHHDSLIQMGKQSGALEVHAGKWRLTTAAKKLLEKSGDDSMLALLLHLKIVMRPFFQWEVLKQALVTGGNQWRTVFGANVNSPFDAYVTHPEITSFLMGGMHALSSVDSADLVSRLDIKSIHSALDLGGGTGVFALALKHANPNLNVSVYDLPDAIPTLEKILKTHNPEGFHIPYVGGSFLKGSADALDGIATNQKFDLIVAGWVIHDWSDEDAIAILKRVRSQLSPGGRVALFELIMPDDHVGPETMLDIAMLLQTAGGKERTAAEFKTLLSSAGFTDFAIARTSGRRHVITARVK